MSNDSSKVASDQKKKE